MTLMCDYCDKEAVISLCRFEKNPNTNTVNHSVYKLFCWEDAVKKGIFAYEEPKTEKPLTLTTEDIVKGTRKTA